MALESKLSKLYPNHTGTRTYHVIALEVNLVYNKAGDHDPNGCIYALKEDADEIRQLTEAHPHTPVDMVRPLAIRANEEEIVIIRFENTLPFAASMHIQGIPYDVLDSDGAEAGYNSNTTVKPGGWIEYAYFADKEGIYMFSDLGNPVANESGSNVHGLFGALIVEEAGSFWTNPVTGGILASGLEADIHHPKKDSFREFVLFFHDEPPVLGIPMDHMADTRHEDEVPVTLHAINYRSEPMRIRMPAPGAGCISEDCMHSSWVWGDPATPVLHVYQGDPFKIRLIHGGVKETHVFHLHLYQWRLNRDDPDSTLIDSISFGPQEVYTIEPLYGGGSLQQSYGDAIYHCHLYPHFEEGMWGLLRTHNVLEDGTRLYPDDTPIKALRPLPNRPAPPLPTPEVPGYPLFIPGEVGKKPPRPPLALEGGRTPTELEQNAFAPNWERGALFVNPCPPGAPVRHFDIVAIQLPIKYNSHNWHDPEGRIYVLAEDEEAVRSGQKEPEPLIIRANAGECIEIDFTNKLPLILGGNAFQPLVETIEASCHVHLVKFDVLASDGGNNGWNYDSSAPYMQTFRYRWYADEELRTCFFHDHLFANSHQQHGLFAALIVEPAGSTYHDPFTGEIIKSGTKAVIKNSDTSDFREFCLAIHDFALLFDNEGNPLNPPPFPGSHEDPGVMAINYKCEPFRFRKGDPAYVFSSYIHGDPVTPILECYEGDPVRIRLFDGAHEEQHAFNLHGCRWLREPANPKSPLVSNQTLGISEAFNLEFTVDTKGDADLLYYSGGIDDLWLGMWGILRVYGSEMNHLLPLEDRPLPTLRQTPFPQKTESPPPKASHPGNPCPPNAPTVFYDIVALQTTIHFNQYGDHDPNGIVFVLAEDEKAVIKGKKAPEPLVIRANAGDCIEIRLTNRLPQNPALTEFPHVPVESPWPPSNRISLHPQKLKYDARGSDGTTVGFNPDQTIAPGESITYRWYADVELGAILLTGFADLRNHRHHGAYAVLIIEPEGAVYLDTRTGKKLKSGAEAEIRLSENLDYREFVIVAQNGIDMYDAAGRRILSPTGEELDFEDQGQKAYNYRSAPFANRLARLPNRARLFSSKVHGDPKTPVFRAYCGDPVVFRYVMAGDKPRNTTFTVHGHKWHTQPQNPLSQVKGLEGALSYGDTRDIRLIGGAAKPKGWSGDFMYRSGIIRWDLEQGMWGLMRVFNWFTVALKPLRNALLKMLGVKSE